MKQALRLITAVCGLSLVFLGLAPLGLSAQDVRSVDDEINDLRSKLVKINADLDELEKDLLLPRMSAVKIFLTSSSGRDFQLEQVKVLLNGKVVGSHVYRQEENIALDNGGAQELYMGPISEGEHTIQAQFSGVDSLKTKVNRAIQIKFRGRSRVLSFVELKVSYDRTKRAPDFTYDIWE
ncbi:MAG: hypothetical protein KIT79_05085 [Deltaproteobacteria bacterium]|nr:hypothetical protein [Deltaproteobacteria bacterium]